MCDGGVSDSVQYCEGKLKEYKVSAQELKALKCAGDQSVKTYYSNNIV